MKEGAISPRVSIFLLFFPTNPPQITCCICRIKKIEMWGKLMVIRPGGKNGGNWCEKPRWKREGSLMAKRLEEILCPYYGEDCVSNQEEYGEEDIWYLAPAERFVKLHGRWALPLWPLSGRPRPESYNRKSLKRGSRDTLCGELQELRWFNDYMIFLISDCFF